MIELLSPAGSPESVIAAVQNGADAVYLGLGDFNARRGAKNFTDEEFRKAMRYCRVRGCKVYVTLNTLVGDREMRDVVEAARLASDEGADGLIVQDLGMAAAIRRYQAEKNRLMDAVKICNNASRMLAQSWAGPSFAALSVKMASTYKNLSQSITKMDDAIEELNQTIRIMEGAERKVASSAAALDLGVSPFA